MIFFGFMGILRFFWIYGDFKIFLDLWDTAKGDEMR
jgi:hypothetical protein